MPVQLLVVDDEPDLELLIRQKFRKEIRDQTFCFQFAEDGVEALERLTAAPQIDIVLTDINMPRMDGLTLLSRIEAMDRLVKVVVVSAYNDMSNIRTAMNRGAFDFIVKPIDFDDLHVTIEKTFQELEALRRSVQLQERLTAIERELEIASTIQSSALPSSFPAFPDRSDFSLHATTLPAQEVGGDFYDFFLIDEHRLGFALGDVSGKGVGAALLMAITRTLLRATALQEPSVDGCVRHVNRVLFPESPTRMFVTLLYGVLNARKGTVTYCNAGHHEPFVIRTNGEPSSTSHHRNLGLCLKEDFAYQSDRIDLAPGDSLFLYTDGITEAVNPERERFAETRLRRTLTATAGMPPAAAIREVLHAVTNFTDDSAPSDDLTMLALQYHG